MRVRDLIVQIIVLKATHTRREYPRMVQYATHELYNRNLPPHAVIRRYIARNASAAAPIDHNDAAAPACDAKVAFGRSRIGRMTIVSA